MMPAVQYDKNGRIRKAPWECWFLYTAFAEMGGDEVLIKIGISSMPYERVGEIHQCCPFPVSMAAFTSVGKKGRALECERRILETYRSHSTRGEWLRVPATKEFKAEFADKVRAIVMNVTSNPVVWTRLSNSQIVSASETPSKYRRQVMRDLTGTGFLSESTKPKLPAAEATSEI